MTEKPKKKLGRPTSYKPEYCQALIDHMEKGKSFETFGHSVGVSRDRVYEWVKKHEDFAEAKRRALDASLAFWEDKGIEGLWSGGRNQPSFNATVWVFTMKNRFGWRDNKDATIGVESSTAPQIVITLPDNGRSAESEDPNA